MKRCPKCKKTKPVADFYRNRSQADGLNVYCKPCWAIQMDARRNGPEREKHLRWRRNRHLERKYGITLLDYERMLAEQGGGCAICGATKSPGRMDDFSLSVDHCAETGKVRGILCNSCNRGIGLFQHSSKTARLAGEYLKRNGY